MGNVRVVLHPVASPLALGTFGVAGASLTLSGLELGWIPHDEQIDVGLILIVFASLPQLIASIVAFLARNPMAATAMGVLAVTWGVEGVVLAVAAPEATSKALGTLLLVAVCATLASAAEAASAKLVPAAVLASTGLRFALSGIYQLGAGIGVARASGVVGLAVTAIALYAGVALSLEDLRHRTVLPTGRHGDGAAAMTGDFARQAKDLAKEAGVRSQL